MILACKGCGRTKRAADGTPDDVHPSEHCGSCPPWSCETCGEACSATALCSCWVSLDGMAHADVKALFATDGTFNVGGLAGPRGSDGRP